jgi:selenocysteine lyase/cysteine desulfurase
MYISKELNETLPNQGHYFNERMATKRFTPAGPDHAQMAAMAGIVDYFKALGQHHFGQKVSEIPSNMTKRLGDLQQKTEENMLLPLLDYINSRNDIRLLGPKVIESRVPTVSLVCEERPELVADRLAEKGILVGWGDFYAVRLLEALGIDCEQGVLRISFVHYTQSREVKNLINALDQVL